MNEKEVAELRRQFRPDHHNITKVYGCYVNENKTVISTFEQSMALATQEEAESYLSLLKKSLSGTLGRNLLDIAFTNQQVMNGAEHALLMKLRESRLEDAEALETFYHKVIESVYLESNYLILLTFHTYDVPYRAKDDIELEDASEEMFSYLLCSICPVKKSKPGLGYDYHQQEFHTCTGDYLVAAPEIGFLFPAFDDRRTNLYNALCYTRKVDESHEEFIDAVFHTEIPQPAAEQKKSFEAVLSHSLEEECSMEVVQAVHDQLSSLIAEHKESKIPEPLMIHKTAVEEVLEDCGISDKHIESFREQFDAEFGEDRAVSPKNIIDEKKFEVKMPQVKIQVKPEARDLVKTETIDGVRYIMIRAEESVEVNGVSIQFEQEDKLSV
ncbi:MAG: DUF4317 domain-containing protein [Eubacteriales bacterium]|nr:DUF4317 domain-containing protein [Eubacteriales bacterium]